MRTVDSDGGESWISFHNLLKSPLTQHAAAVYHLDILFALLS